MSDDGPNGYAYTIAEQAHLVGAWIDHLQLDQLFVMVVQDWGGPIGLLNAVQRPDDVGALCIMNTWAWVPDRFTRNFGRVLSSRVGRQLIERRNFFATTGIRQGIVTAKSKSQSVFDAYTAPFPDKTARYPTWVMPRELLMNDARLEQLEQDLSKLKGKPTEMVWGMADRGFGKESVITRWHQALGDVPTTRLDDAGHFLQEDRPGAIAEAIHRLVAQIS
jgi:haloalkane dehalogenase